MADHLRKQIRAAVVASGVLGNLTTTGTRVLQGRTTPLAADAQPTLLVDLGEEQIETSAIGASARARMLKRELELIVRGAVKAASGYLDTLDAIALEVETAIANNSTLGGLAKTIRPAGMDTPELDGQGEKTVAILNMRFIVEYYTTQNAPQTPR